MELGLTVLVLIRKDNLDNQWIGMLEVVCKVVRAMIDTRIKTVV